MSAVLEVLVTVNDMKYEMWTRTYIYIDKNLQCDSKCGELHNHRPTQPNYRKVINMFILDVFNLVMHEFVLKTD